MIKLVDLLKELNIQSKIELGAGMNGWAYPLGKDKVVKKFANPITQEEIEDYELFNQHPDIFPHVYKVTEKWVVMDKLDTTLKGFRDTVPRFMQENGWIQDAHYNPKLYLEHGWKYDSKTGLSSWVGDGKPDIDDEFLEDAVYKVFDSVRRNDFKPINSILQKAKEQGKTDIYNTIKEILDFSIKLNKVFKGQIKDIHKENIGRGSDGKLKVFDTAWHEGK